MIHLYIIYLHQTRLVAWRSTQPRHCNVLCRSPVWCQCFWIRSSELSPRLSGRFSGTSASRLSSGPTRQNQTLSLQGKTRTYSPSTESQNISVYPSPPVTWSSFRPPVKLDVFAGNYMIRLSGATKPYLVWNYMLIEKRMEICKFKSTVPPCHFLYVNQFVELLLC